MQIASVVQVLKTDIFGRIELVELADGRRAVRRRFALARWWARPLAAYLARREKRCLEALAAIDDDRLPRLLFWGDGSLVRSYITAANLYHVRPADPAFYDSAKDLLDRMHALGVAHNDLAKEANWLAIDRVTASLTDFQLAFVSRRRGRFFRLCAREDYRHLLKQKRRYCPEHLTDDEKHVLRHKSIISRVWMKTGKPVYNFVTRKILHYSDRGDSPRSP